MGEIILKNAVVRKPNHLYYIDGQGNICVSEMKHGRKKGTGKVKKAKKINAKTKKPAKKTTSKKK